MYDTSFDVGTVPAQPRRKGRLLVAVILLALVGAMIGGTWLAWHQGWLKLQLAFGPDATPAQTANPVPSPQRLAAAADAAATNAALASAAGRVTALEQQLAELNQQAIAASGQATHAEALLVAFAARRAIDRGQPLGALETQLRVRFGESQPGAVDRVIGAAARPVTLGSLAEDFTRLEPQLAGAAPGEGGWGWFTRQLGGLFVIRHDNQAASTPESRIAHTREAIAGGRIEVAIADVERMPGRNAANEWLAHARDWLATQHALDQIEGTALTLPVAQPAAHTTVTVPDETAPAPQSSEAVGL